jgi:hypothetical protein
VRRLTGILVPVGLVLASTMIALLLGESFARIAVNPGDFLPATRIEDPALGYRIQPNSTGHDALGNRNPAVPAQAGVIVLGDSMTYGFGVPREASWPHQLGVLLGEPVYNMAHGGYGPLQYLHLAQHEAVKLRPRLLVVGLFLGNDMIDAYSAAYRFEHWREWREPGVLETLGADFYQSVGREPKKRFASLRDWLASHSVLYSLLRATLFARLTLWEQERLANSVTPDRRWVWSDPAMRSIGTIFGPLAGLAAMDPQLPIVQEGLRITKQALSMMKDAAEARDIRLLVVLIPTKERVYCSSVKELGDGVPGAHLRLCGVEDALKRELSGHLVQGRIAHVDVTAAMEAGARRHVPLYPRGGDGHPLTSGHAEIARAVHDALRRPKDGG